jgi:hypothetical protein
LKTKYEGAETGDTIQEKARIFVQNLIQVKVFKFSLLQKSNYLAFLFQPAKKTICRVLCSRIFWQKRLLKKKKTLADFLGRQSNRRPAYRDRSPTARTPAAYQRRSGTGEPFEFARAAGELERPSDAAGCGNANC